MRWRLALAAALSMVACGSEPDGPSEIAYGLEECDFCRMIISQEAHAAAVVGSDGSTRAFDDLGCLLEARERWMNEGARVWVHDVESLEWLEAAEAVFVRQDAASTPMGSGLVAVATRDRAARRAADEDAIYDWQGLVSRDEALDGFMDHDTNHDTDHEEETGR